MVSFLRCEGSEEEIAVRTAMVADIPEWFDGPAMFYNAAQLQGLPEVMPLPLTWGQGSCVQYPDGELRGVSHEEGFVLRAMASGVNAALAERPIRRLFRRKEVEAELLWRKWVQWDSPNLVFAVAVPAASCSFCFDTAAVLGTTGVKLWDVTAERETDQVLKGPCDVSVEVMRRVAAVNLTTLTLRNALVLLVGYTTDLAQLAAFNMWQDCHLGNILMTDVYGVAHFLWHDFGALSRHAPPVTSSMLDGFRRNMKESLARICDALSRYPEAEGLMESVRDLFDHSMEGGGQLLVEKLHYRSVQVQDLVIGWREGPVSVRSDALALIARVASPSRHEALQALLAASGDVWVRELLLPGTLAGNPFQVTGALRNIDNLKVAIKARSPRRVQCDADDLDIYREVDGTWVKERAMSAALRASSEGSPYGFVVPAT